MSEKNTLDKAAPLTDEEISEASGGAYNNSLCTGNPGGSFGEAIKLATAVCQKCHNAFSYVDKGQEPPAFCTTCKKSSSMMSWADEGSNPTNPIF